MIKNSAYQLSIGKKSRVKGSELKSSEWIKKILVEKKKKNGVAPKVVGSRAISQQAFGESWFMNFSLILE